MVIRRFYGIYSAAAASVLWRHLLRHIANAASARLSLLGAYGERRAIFSSVATPMTNLLTGLSPNSR